MALNSPRPIVTAVSRTDALLEQVIERLDRLTARVERLEQRRRRRDPEADARLVSAIAVERGAEVFSADDLRASSHRELREALGAVDGRALGTWLKRLRGKPVAGYVLRRVKRGDSGMVWSLTADVSALRHTATSAPARRGASSAT